MARLTVKALDEKFEAYKSEANTQIQRLEAELATTKALLEQLKLQNVGVQTNPLSVKEIEHGPEGTVVRFASKNGVDGGFIAWRHEYRDAGKTPFVRGNWTHMQQALRTHAVSNPEHKEIAGQLVEALDQLKAEAKARREAVTA